MNFGGAPGHQRANSSGVEVLNGLVELAGVPARFNDSNLVVSGQVLQDGSTPTMSPQVAEGQLVQDSQTPFMNPVITN